MAIQTKSNYFTNWQNNRINFILEKYDESFFENKKILELGSFNGYIGNFFKQDMKADVTCVEGRTENIFNILFTYPELKLFQMNLDTPHWNLGKFDIIINFGLFYHLEHFHKEHLRNCIENSDLMFFESVIYDSDEDELFFREEIGPDQSLSSQGGSPSTSFVENIFAENNCNYTKYCDHELNGDNHHYDWTDINSKNLDQYARRFWIVSK